MDITITYTSSNDILYVILINGLINLPETETTGDASGMSGTCFGDSGGALLVEVVRPTRKFVQIGIVQVIRNYYNYDQTFD